MVECVLVVLLLFCLFGWGWGLLGWCGVGFVCFVCLCVCFGFLFIGRVGCLIGVLCVGICLFCCLCLLVWFLCVVWLFV